MVGIVTTTAVVVVGSGIERHNGGRRGSLISLDPAALATVSLHATPEAMAAIFGAVVDKDLCMRVPLKGTGFDAVSFSWDNRDLSHVKSFGFTSKRPIANDAEARKALQGLLGWRLEKSTSFSWADANLDYEPTNLSAEADPKTSNPGKGPDDPHWMDRLDALWDVARTAVLGLNVPVSDVERRDWLAGGYPLSSLEALDLDIDVDGSTAMMRRAFPGVSSDAEEGLRFDVPIDHPWFSEATLVWPNVKGGLLTTVRVGGPPGMPSLPNQADIETCLEGAYGKGSTVDEDHLKGTHMSIYNLPEGDVRVDQYSVDIIVDSFGAQHFTRQQRKDMRLAPPMAKSAWIKVIARLDACGQK
jgi:hypothetical protein